MDGWTDSDRPTDPPTVVPHLPTYIHPHTRTHTHTHAPTLPPTRFVRWFVVPPTSLSSTSFIDALDRPYPVSHVSQIYLSPTNHRLSAACLPGWCARAVPLPSHLVPLRYSFLTQSASPRTSAAATRFRPRAHGSPQRACQCIEPPLLKLHYGQCADRTWQTRHHRLSSAQSCTRSSAQSLGSSIPPRRAPLPP